MGNETIMYIVIPALRCTYILSYIFLNAID